MKQVKVRIRGISPLLIAPLPAGAGRGSGVAWPGLAGHDLARQGTVRQGMAGKAHGAVEDHRPVLLLFFLSSSAARRSEARRSW
jgi:hypothetical protein